MFYLDDKDYIPLIAVTLASSLKNQDELKKLFEAQLESYDANTLINVFNAHHYCNSLTINEYMSYQWFYSLCIIDQNTKNKELEAKLQKFFRMEYPDIYKIVRKSKSFNIMDYYFLNQETNSLSIINKLNFSNRAVALMFFIFNKWGDSDRNAYAFAKSLYDIVSADKNIANKPIQKKQLSISNFESQKKQLESHLEKENYELCIERIYELFRINFEMLFCEFGRDRQALSDANIIEEIVLEQFPNANEAMSFLVYNLVLLMSALEHYMSFIEEKNVLYIIYQNEKLTEALKKQQILLQKFEARESSLLAKKDEQNQRLIKQLNDVQKKNIALQESIAAKQRELKETVALRNYIYQLEQEHFDDVNVIEWEKVNILRGTIVGGSDSWQRKLKEKLPDWRFISVSMEQYDKNIVANCEYVFVNTSYIGHSLYYKIASMVQNADGVKLGFINNSNMDRVYQEIVLQFR